MASSDGKVTPQNRHISAVAQLCISTTQLPTQTHTYHILTPIFHRIPYVPHTPHYFEILLNFLGPSRTLASFYLSIWPTSPFKA